MGFHLHLPSLPKIHIPRVVQSVAHAAEHAAQSVGHTVQHAAHDLGRGVHATERAAGHALSHATHDLGRGLHSAERGLQHAAHEAGVLVHQAGGLARQAAHDAAVAVVTGGRSAARLLAKATATTGQKVLHLRPLDQAERAAADPVFKGTVPLDRVLLCPLSGLGDRPFTLPGSLIMSATGLIGASPVGAVLFAAELMADLIDKYVIFIGPQGYKDALNHPWDYGKGGQTLIHELTHVWQGTHSGLAWAYVAKSCRDQVAMGTTAAYDIKPAVTRHAQWKDIGVEAQARLVETWYAGGSPEREVAETANQFDLYPYVRDVVRPGNPGAVTRFNPPTA